MRAALAAGRIGDREAIPGLAKLLDEAEAGETAAWALGRIESGVEPLVRCVERRCAASFAAARALSGPAAFQQPAVPALIAVAGQLRSGEDVLDALQPGDTILAASAE